MTTKPGHHRAKRYGWIILVLCACLPGCRDGYRVVQTCDQVDCSGHGTCAMTIGQGLICICDPGYVADGLECVEGGLVHPCEGVDCSGHGTCGVTSDGEVLCACEAGYHNQDSLTCVPDVTGCISDEQCDDENICTDDACLAGECGYVNNNDPCDDGLFCTATDACRGGVCQGAGDACPQEMCDEAANACVECLEDMDCADGNPCTDDGCPAGACAHVDNSDPCDDGLFCTATDTCSGGVCQGTGDPCGWQVCDEVNDVCVAELYWGTYGNQTLGRTLPGTSDHQILVTGTRVHDLEVVASSGIMYWADRDGGTVYSSSVFAPSAQVLISIGSPVGLAVDRTAQKLYHSRTFNGGIWVSDLDGSNLTAVLSGVSANGLALDPAAGKIYWVTGSEAQRCNLDGSGLEVVVSVPDAGSGTSLSDVILDQGGQRLLMADYNNGRVATCNLDGSGLIDLLTGLTNPHAMVIDYTAGKLYVGDLHGIHRSNLDGTSFEYDLVDHPSAGQVWGLAFPR